MNIAAEVGVAGKYKLEVERADGGTDSYPWMDNLVLDQGLDHVMFNSGQQAYNAYNSIWVGSGKTLPQASDTWLEEEYTSAINPTVDTGYGAVNSAGDMYSWWRGEYVFDAITDADGVVLTECGVGYRGATAINGLLTTRSVFLDRGSLFSLALKFGDILKIVYEIQVYAPTVPVVTSFDLNDNPLETRTVTTYPVAINQSGYWSVDWSTNTATVNGRAVVSGVGGRTTVPTSLYTAPVSADYTAFLSNGSPKSLLISDCNFVNGIDSVRIFIRNTTNGSIHASFLSIIDPPIMKTGVMIGSYSFYVTAVRYS
jgi:hypothetical protein